MNGSELNRSLRREDGELYDIIAGDFLVVGLGKEDFISLEPEQMQQFEEVFHQPEMFVRMGTRILSIPLDDEKAKKSDAPEKHSKIPQKNVPEKDIR